MADSQTAYVQGQPVTCPVCKHDHFTTTNFHVAGTFPQIFNIEIIGRRGVMLICARCSWIRSSPATRRSPRRSSTTR